MHLKYVKKKINDVRIIIQSIFAKPFGLPV